MVAMTPTSPEGPSGLVTAAYAHTLKHPNTVMMKRWGKKSPFLKLVYHTAVLTLFWVATSYRHVSEHRLCLCSLDKRSSRVCILVWFWHVWYVSCPESQKSVISTSLKNPLQTKTYSPIQSAVGLENHLNTTLQEIMEELSYNVLCHRNGRGICITHVISSPQK